MFTVDQISKQIGAVAENRLSIDDFEDWFVAASWGFFDIQRDPLSSAIAAVRHVLNSLESEEIAESQVSKELASAIRPFESAARVEVVDSSDSRPTAEWNFNFGRHQPSNRWGFLAEGLGLSIEWAAGA